MTQRILIFDLSETLIAGIVGIEKPLSRRLSLEEHTILPAFAGEIFRKLCCGELSENIYLESIIEQQGWTIPIEELKHIIRQNFHTQVPGMVRIVQELSTHYPLFLLSDHAREWVTYIQEIHPFLNCFQQQFYSFALGKTKQEVATFQQILATLNQDAADCLFIDDSPRNIAVARDLGIPSIHFTTASAFEDEMAALNL